jgi:hypothetical protein
MRPSTLLPAILAPLVYAAHLRLAIAPNNHLSNPSILLPSTTASLTTLSRTYTTPLRVDNTFDFRNVSKGSYLLDVHCHTHVFAPLRVDVGQTVGEEEGLGEKVEVWGTFRGNEWSNKGPVVEVQDLGQGIKIFEARCLGGKEYFLERGGCKYFSEFCG